MEQRGVRWGLVLVTVLVGTVALSQGLAWYFDPMRQPLQKVAPRPTPVPRADRASAGIPAPLPPPTTDQLEDLASGNIPRQLSAAYALQKRAVTPELESTVEAALLGTRDERLEQQLVCLKSRWEGPETLEFLLARFPTDRMKLDWNIKPDVVCLLDALVERAAAAPERIRDALMPAIYASNATTRGKVLQAFRKMSLPDIPAPLVAEAITTGTGHQREAMAAVVALGAVRLHPALMERALRNYGTRSSVREELRTSPHPNAARILAKASSEPDLFLLAMDRERAMHDVSAALLEIVLDQSQPEAQRVFSTYQLERIGEIGALPGLIELSSSLGPGKLKTNVDLTVRSLESRQKRSGAKARMRPLTP